MVPFFFLLLVLPLVLYHPTALADEDLFGYDPKSWEKAAEYLYSGLNPNVKPCDNFFEHVCGNYKWKNESDYELAAAYKQKQYNDLAIKLIKEIDLSNPNTPAYKKSLGTFFGECVKTFERPTWVVSLYNALAKRIGPIGLEELTPTDPPHPTEAPPPMESPHPTEAPPPMESPHPTEAPPPMESPHPTEAPPPMESPHPTEAPPPMESPHPTEAPPPTELPHLTDPPHPTDPPYDPVDPVMLSDNGSPQQEAWRLLGLMERELQPGIFVKYVISDGPVSTFLPQDRFVVKVCTNLTSKMLENVTNLLNIGELKDQHKYEIMKKNIADLCFDLSVLLLAMMNMTYEGELFDDTKASLAPDFMWKDVLQGMIAPEHLAKISQEMKLYLDPAILEILDGFGKAFQKAGIDTVRLLTFVALSSDVANATPNNSETACLDKAKHDYAPALARLFLDHFGRNATTMRLELLQFTRNIISAFRLFLNAVKWVDADDKDRIHQKLDSIKIDPGLQDWLNDDEEISRRIPLYDPNVDLFENEFNGRKRVFDYMIQRIVDGVFVSEPYNIVYSYPAFDVNANYNPVYSIVRQGPRMHLHAAIAFPPLFDINYPAPVKYGGIGSIIGHELMHAFDATNINAPLLDGRPLLKEAALQKYKKHQECLAAAFSHHCTGDRNFCLKGDQVLGENLADIAGVKIAYAAYKFITQMVGQESSLAPLNNYTGDQLFFMAHARFWCEKGYTEELFKDVHSPNRARVEIGYSHIHEFGIAFQCPKPSKYLPKVKCEVWGDMAEQILEKFRESK